jgi:hypothetical protein
MVYFPGRYQGTGTGRCVLTGEVSFRGARRGPQGFVNQVGCLHAEMRFHSMANIRTTGERMVLLAL